MTDQPYYCAYCGIRAVGDWKKLKKQGWSLLKAGTGAKLQNSPKSPVIVSTSVNTVSCPTHNDEVLQLCIDAISALFGPGQRFRISKCYASIGDWTPDQEKKDGER